MLGIERGAWECVPFLSGDCLISQRESVFAVADASLYYLDDLKGALGATGATPAAGAADLILAAYLRWGEFCTDHLEGDYAFVIWDGRQRRALIARDYVGRRALFWTRTAQGIALHSSSRALAGLRGGARLNEVTIAAAMSGLLGGSLETGFEDIVPVRGGCTALWSPERGFRVHRQWEPPPFVYGGAVRTPDAIEELRATLTRATSARLAPDTTALWLSGGLDSTSVFACAHQSLRGPAGAGPNVTPVSISYPVGDLAREDDHITAAAEHWNSSVMWLESESIDVFRDIDVHAARRDDPYAHLFEQVTRALASRSAASGARVALDGYGGDQLFHVSAAFLADLLLRLRWRAMARTFSELETHDLRAFIRWCVMPVLPAPVRDRLRWLAQGRMAPAGEPALPKWLDPRMARRAELLQRRQFEPARRFFEGIAAHESRWYLSSPYFPRALAWSHNIARDEGVEVRSPLMDLRLLRFAASRPVLERSGIRESKALLRAAMRSWLPDSVLAPRKRKTGIPRAFLHRQMQAGLRGQIASVFDLVSREIRLADLGLIDLTELREGLAAYEATGDHLTGMQLFLTLQAELWLRSVL